MLSGNVTVVFDGSDLVITGDNAANDVQVFYDGVDVVVRGLNGTTINGAAGDFVAAAATNTLPDSVNVNLGKGNDLFYMSDGVVVTDDVHVESGKGNDKTVLFDLNVGGNIVIGLPFGLGDDPGNDAVLLESVTATTVIVDTGSGHDVVGLVNVSAAEDVIVFLGAGNDALSGTMQAVSNIIVSAGAGNDFIAGEMQAGGIGIDLEAGNDVLFLTDVDQNDAARTASINLGTGNDKATVGLSSASFASFLSVTGSKGNDKFFLLPGATLSDGILISEVESTAPYIAVSDPAVMNGFKATFKRFEDFTTYVSTLP
jgi:hypothetical protein